MKTKVLILTLLIMTYQAVAQVDVDSVLYPFESHYVDLDAGKMHYIDEGKGEVILFVHGTPTWSFLYRDYIKTLSKNYRCIAIDHIGFGMSDKIMSDTTVGSVEWHSENLRSFIEKMDLTNITLVVHDFGGPIGLGAAIQQAERIKGIVLFNTWLWATADNKEVQKIDKIVNSGLGKFLYLKLNFSPKVLLKKGFYDKKKLSKQVHKSYIAPFATKKSRWAPLILAKSLYGASDWYQKQWEQIEQLKTKPILILWGKHDQFIKMDYLDKWKEKFPKAEVQLFDAGHFVQEECFDSSLKKIQDFLFKN